MSFSKKSLNDPILGKHSRTLSEHVTGNGNPLVMKKKACASEKASTTKKITKACRLFTFYFQKNLTFYIRNQVLKRSMTKIIFSFRK